MREVTHTQGGRTAPLADETQVKCLAQGPRAEPGWADRRARSTQAVWASEEALDRAAETPQALANGGHGSANPMSHLFAQTLISLWPESLPVKKVVLGPPAMSVFTGLW